MFHAIFFLLKVICKAIGFVFKAIWKALALLHVRLLALYLAVCGVLQLIFGLFDGANIAYFWAGLLAVIALSVLGAFLVERKKRRKRK